MVRTIVWGLFIIAIGLWIWLAKLGVIGSGIVFRRDWPVIIIVAGVMTLIEGLTWMFRKGRGRRGCGD
jgi:hypothetical protein